MNKKGAKLRIKEWSGPMGSIKDFEFTTGNIYIGDETEWEPMGPYPMPCIPPKELIDPTLLQQISKDSS